MNELATADNLPWAICVAMSLLIADLRTDETPGSQWLWDALNRELTTLTDIIGRCEAIAGTPVPISYSRHSSRVVSVWTLTLPLVLVGVMDTIAGTVLATTCVSWFLLGIEYIGNFIEEPFGLYDVRRPELLPLRRYTNNIILDLKEENRIVQRAQNLAKVDDMKLADSLI